MGHNIVSDSGARDYAVSPSFGCTNLYDVKCGWSRYGWDDGPVQFLKFSITPSASSLYACPKTILKGTFLKATDRGHAIPSAKARDGDQTIDFEFFHNGNEGPSGR